MPCHIRKGDVVKVIAGRGATRGLTGRVLRVLPRESRVIVEGVNVVKKHEKPSQKNPQGGLVEMEAPVHISNVVPLVEGKPTRVRFENRKDGSKVRVAARGGQVIGAELRKAKK